MNTDLMTLRVLLPSEVFVERSDIARIVAETSAGSHGILPHRLDCIAVLPPGILTYEENGQTETCIAVDDGILVKTGRDVLVSVRRAVGGGDLAQLRSRVETEFRRLDESEQNMRAVMARLESSFLRRFIRLQHE